MALQATRVDTKGRIVLPREIRAELGLEPGDILFLETDDDRRIIYIAKPDNPFDMLAVAALEEDRAGLTIDLDDALDVMDTLELDVDVA